MNAQILLVERTTVWMLPEHRRIQAHSGCLGRTIFRCCIVGWGTTAQATEQWPAERR